MDVIEMIHRRDNPLFAAECLLQGEYKKYNNNTGSLVHSVFRETPQTFSHFTFERSHHRLMVVDVQGVGDMYTDPQVHTASGEDFGSGNLGIRGALRHILEAPLRRARAAAPIYSPGDSCTCVMCE